jgi:hypothetical protein
VSQPPRLDTVIPNRSLAGDRMHTNICMTTMDGANQGGRQAVNRVLAASGFPAAPADLWTMYAPPELEPFRAADAARYAAGLPNVFDPDRAALPRRS